MIERFLADNLGSRLVFEDSNGKRWLMVVVFDKNYKLTEYGVYTKPYHRKVQCLFLGEDLEAALRILKG